jgi:hypothetical protein
VKKEIKNAQKELKKRKKVGKYEGIEGSKEDGRKAK